MLDIYGIDHLNFRVKDLERSTNFYKQVFGFKIKEKGFSQMSKANFAIIGISEKAMLCLYEIEPEKTKNLAHFGINIKFEESLVQKLEEMNVKVNHYTEGGVTKYANSKSIYIEDPDGNEIELTSKFGGGL